MDKTRKTKTAPNKTGRLKIEYLPLKDLKPWNRNPRCNDEGVAGLISSIERFGYTNPILIRRADKRIIAGHTRVKALAQIGETHCPCILLDLGKTDADLYALFDNKSVENTPWDIPKLSELFADLQKFDLDLELTGFSPEEIAGLMGDDVKEGLTDDDEVPEVSEKPKTKKGDLYILGEHRLLCGDSTKQEDVERLMGGGIRADLIFTSPPYWVGFEYEREKDKESILQHISKSSEILTKFCKGRIVINTGNISSLSNAEKVTGKRQPALLIDWWIDALNKNNYFLRHIRIWAKNGGVMPSRANDKIDMNWEYLGLFTDQRGTAGFISTFKNATDESGQKIGTPTWAVNGVWHDIQGKARESGHVASFPVELPMRYLMMYTNREMILFEPYCGSGSTMIACEKLGRRCFGMEIEPMYCDVIVERWQQFTGGKAKREKT